MATRKTHQEQKDYSKYSRCFSSELKKEIVRDIERGALSISEISISYSVSRTSIYRWIYRYSIKLKKGTVQIVERKSQTRKIQALQARIKELEHLVGIKQIQLEFSEKMVELGSAEVGFDLKKKYASKASSTSGNIEKK